MWKQRDLEAANIVTVGEVTHDLRRTARHTQASRSVFVASKQHTFVVVQPGSLIAWQSVVVGIRSERRFLFDADRAAVWQAVIRTDQYRVWWPWLHGFDGATFEEGSQWHCAVKPPLPYVLRFQLGLVNVVDQDTVLVAVTGDLTGHGLLTLTDHDLGTELRLSYDLNPSKRTLQTVVKVARPAVVIALDWVLDTGARQFGHAALQE